MTEAVKTTNHKVIRSWAESRDGHPAMAGGKLLRIDFGEPDERLEKLGWDEFFRVFEEEKLAFLHQDMLDDGAVSRFNKFVER